MGKAEGKDNFFAEDPLAFSQLIWKDRKEQFHLANEMIAGNKRGHLIFFDRGLADVTAYLRHTNSPQNNWEKELSQYPYDKVFSIAPVAAIYHKDESRMESFQEALSLHQVVKESYEELGPLIEVPFLTPEERMRFILKHCDEG
jgi:predicted ATPase